MNWKSKVLILILQLEEENQVVDLIHKINGSSQGLYDIDKQMWNSLLETGRYIPPKPRSSQIKKWWKESLLEVDSAPPIWEAQSQLMKIYNQYRNSSLISEEPNKFEIYEQSKQRN